MRLLACFLRLPGRCSWVAASVEDSLGQGLFSTLLAVAVPLEQTTIAAPYFASSRPFSSPAWPAASDTPASGNEGFIGTKHVVCQWPRRYVHGPASSSGKNISQRGLIDESDNQRADFSGSQCLIVDPNLVDVAPGHAMSVYNEGSQDGGDQVDGEDATARYNTFEASSKLPVVFEADLITDESTSSDESALSDLEFGEEYIKWPASELDLAINGEGGKDDISELRELDVPEMQEFLGNVAVNEDSGEGVPKVIKSHDGRSYLHELSADEVREILEKARAKDVRILDVRQCCEWVDQLVFASGRSSRHLRGMADALVYKVKKSSENVGPNSFPTVEGRDGEQWMAVDCGNLVVHLFLDEARSYYNLEQFWRERADLRLLEAL